MKRDVIIGQKLFETCKLSEFYLNLIVNSKYEDESPFQLAKAYTQKLYEIVERYDRLLEANSQRENLNLQLDTNTASSNRSTGGGPKKPSSSVCSTPASTLQGSQARTSTPNKCFTSPSSSLATQLQLQLQMQQLHSQSTPATPCQSTSTSSINLYNLTHNAASSTNSHHTGMRQSSSNYQLGSGSNTRRRRHFAHGPAYKLNSISNSNINSNFYKQNQQRLYSIYYEDYYTSDEDEHGNQDEDINESIVDHDDDDDNEVAGYDEELTVRNDYGGHNYKTMTLTKAAKSNGRSKKSRTKNRRDSLADENNGDDMDSTILSSNNNNVSVRLDDISYDYGEYQHDTQIDLDDTSSQHNMMSSGALANANVGLESQAIEKSYSNLSKDSGVLIDSYHSDYSSHHFLNLTNNSSSLNTQTANSRSVALSSVRGSKAAESSLESTQTPVTTKSLRKAGEKSTKKSAKGALTLNGTTSSSASISDNDETNAEQENQLLSHTRLNQYMQSDDGANETINYADDDEYDYEGHEDDEHENEDDENSNVDDEDEDEDDDDFDDDEEPHQYNITDSTHILMKKKAAKRSQASSSLIAKLKSPPKESTPLAKLAHSTSTTATPTIPSYNHYVKNPNKYSPIRASKLAFMPNKSSLISSRQSIVNSGAQDFDFLGTNKKQLSLIAEKQSEMDEHFESDTENETESREKSLNPNYNQQLNLDLDSMSMISMMVESEEQRRIRNSSSSGNLQSPGKIASIDQKVKSFSNKIESMTNRLKSDITNEPANSFLSNSYSSSSTLSTPSPTSSSASSSSAETASPPQIHTSENSPIASEAPSLSSVPPPSPFTANSANSMGSNKSSPFLFNSISSMNVSMLDNIQATNTSLDFDNMNTSILMFN